MKLSPLCLFLGLLLVLPGCNKKEFVIAHRDLEKIKIGMTKQEIIDQIGEPAIFVKGNPRFNVLDIWIYPVIEKARYVWYGLMYICSFGFYTPNKNIVCCMLFFSDDILEQWTIANNGYPIDIK